jgi:hypothetical protein
VAQNEKLDPELRQAAAQFFGDAAMKLLREAVRKGYQDMPNMKKDTDLAPLRHRPEFQQLVMELEGRAK